MSVYGYFFDNMFLKQVGVVTVQAADDKPRLVNVCRRPSSRPTSGKLSKCRRFVLNSKGSTSKKRNEDTIAHIAGPRFDVIINSPPGYEQFFNPADAENGRIFTSSSVIEGLGGEPDEYSVVSLEATAPVTGFITLYKPDERNGASSGFGDKGFDFALVYPALLPQKNIVAFPLNTHKQAIGVHKYSVAANWIRLADTTCGNGKGVSGRIHYISADGAAIKSDPVSQPDCFRFDYAGHDDKLAVGKFYCLDLNDPTEPIVDATSPVSCPLGRRGQILHLVKEEVETVGTAIFMPDAKSDTFIAGLGRYYYDCGVFGAGCNNFNSAFIIPVMAPQGGTLVAPAHILDGQIAVSEISNISNVASQLNMLFRAHEGEGLNLGSTMVNIPNLGVRHVVLNKVGNAGFVQNNQVASAHLLPGGQETVTGLSIFYKKDASNEKLLYAFGAQALAIGGKEQVLPFNTFIQNTNSFTVQALAFPVTCDATVKSVIGGNLLTFPNGSTTKTFRVEPYGTVYETLGHLPKDQYGEVRLKCNRDQVIAQSYLKRGDDYTVAFPGRNGLLED